MTPENQLLSRNLSNITQDCWFLGFPETSPLLTSTDQQITSLYYYHYNKGDSRFHFNLNPPDQPVSQVILYFPKSKQEAEMLIRYALSNLKESGRLWLVGDNKGGIKSCKSLLAKLNLKAEKIDSARHCSLMEIIPADPIDCDIQDYFQEWLPVSGLKLASLPGVFAKGKLDKGTELLLKHLPTKPDKFIDFGAGSGVIGLELLKLGAQSVSLCETSLMAILSLQESISRYYSSDKEKIRIVSTATPTDLSSLKGTAHHVVSNPPFHQGIKTSYSTTESFLKESFQWVLPNGDITIVANDFLKYEEIMRAIWGNCKELARASGFKVLKAYK